MTKWFSLALVVAGALGLCIWQLQRANDAKMQALQTEMKKLVKVGADANARAESAERVVPAIVRQIAAAQPAAVTAATPSSAEVPSAQEPALASAQPGPSLEDQKTHVESVFTLQTVDAGWAQATQAHLNEHLAKQLGPSTLDSLECRENLCKAQLAHRDTASYSAFLDRLIGNANDVWKGAIVYYQEATAEGDKVRTSVYFAKEGTEFPHL
jgi:hypothetical protein